MFLLLQQTFKEQSLGKTEVLSGIHNSKKVNCQFKSIDNLQQVGITNILKKVTHGIYTNYC